MEHYCTIHDCEYFKTEKMRGYAHPIKDGGELLGWCNEKATPDTLQEPTPRASSKADPTRLSIERQTSLKAATDFAIAQLQNGTVVNSSGIILVAALFEAYLATGELVKS
tara:strand:+ start:279 stop:608 length:330 start_codon:yes stop_codon:yes gene_type:complete